MYTLTERFHVRGGGKPQYCETGCDYEIVFTFYGLGFPSPHLGMPGLAQGLKKYQPMDTAHNINQNLEYPSYPIQ